MAVDSKYIVQISGVEVSLGESVFKTAQSKMSAKLIEKGVTLHVASQYNSNIKRTKMQPYKFLIRNIWTPIKIEEAIPEGLPDSPMGFGPVKVTATGAFTILKSELEESHAKIINEVKESGKTKPVKICLGFQKSDEEILDRVTVFLENLKSILAADNFQGYCLYKKYVLKGNKKNSEKYLDYICEVFIGNATQEVAAHIQNGLESFREQKIYTFYGFFNDFASINE